MTGAASSQKDRLQTEGAFSYVCTYRLRGSQNYRTCTPRTPSSPSPSPRDAGGRPLGGGSLGPWLRQPFAVRVPSPPTRNALHNHLVGVLSGGGKKTPPDTAPPWSENAPPRVVLLLLQRCPARCSTARLAQLYSQCLQLCACPQSRVAKRWLRAHLQQLCSCRARPMQGQRESTSQSCCLRTKQM